MKLVYCCLNKKYSISFIYDFIPFSQQNLLLAVTEPAYGVTHWDGLQHIKNPEQYPFYHVIPDRNDVMVAFGGERPRRYVCEENLELCPKENRDLDIDLEPEWTTDVKNVKYVPSDELRLRHGEELEDDGLTAKCLGEIKVRLFWNLVVLDDIFNFVHLQFSCS